MNTFRWNLACKCRRSVCSNTPNLTFIGNRGSVQEPPKSQNLPKIVVFGHWKLTQWTLLDEIWHVSVDVRSALAHQIWPSSVIGGRYRSSRKWKFAQNCGFRQPEADTMNTFRRNLACKCIRSVCFSTPNLTLIGKKGPVQEPHPPKSQNLPRADTMNTFTWNLACKPSAFRFLAHPFHFTSLLYIPSPSFPPLPFLSLWNRKTVWAWVAS